MEPLEVGISGRVCLRLRHKQASLADVVCSVAVRLLTCGGRFRTRAEISRLRKTHLSCGNRGFFFRGNTDVRCVNFRVRFRPQLWLSA